ncbi:hypothetical protein [Paraburkholderia sediminicola]|uniref:hypothetical protein n=1 Tax=Paraburkholderia sediminicola TaxID=458836 RepID=UPI0038BB1E79
MNQNTFICCSCLFETGLNGNGASSERAHAGRAPLAARIPPAREPEMQAQKRKGKTAARRGLVPTAHPQTHVRHGAAEDRHQAGHRDGFPRPDVRVMRSIKWATAANTVCMEKQSMDRGPAFERFFLA